MPAPWLPPSAPESARADACTVLQAETARALNIARAAMATTQQRAAACFTVFDGRESLSMEDVVSLAGAGDSWTYDNVVSIAITGLVLGLGKLHGRQLFTFPTPLLSFLRQQGVAGPDGIQVDKAAVNAFTTDGVHLAAGAEILLGVPTVWEVITRLCSSIHMSRSCR